MSPTFFDAAAIAPAGMVPKLFFESSLLVIESIVSFLLHVSDVGYAWLAGKWN
jgi:hypothetical protein